MNDYKLVNATAMNMAQIESELNTQAASMYYYKATVVVGSNTYLVFSVKALSR